MIKNPLFLSGIHKICKKFDLYLVDLWGVVHDGIKCNAEALKTLKILKKTSKIILISNAPRPNFIVKKFLIKMNFNKKYYHSLITSGDVTRNFLRANYKNKKIYHLGATKDNVLFKGLKIKKVSIEHADVVVCTGLASYDNLKKYNSVLKKIKKKKLLMICANPDLTVNRGNKLEFCAGSIAKMYKKMGGNVKYFGKPYKNFYDYCFSMINKNVKKSRTLIIGDNLDTDILGANTMKINNLFIWGGVHKAEIEKKNLGEFIINKNKYFPINFFQKELIW
jgi:HAD superfamily hydrolase (TIGR01459 family)